MSEMITTSFGLLFYLKKGKKSIKNEQPIYLRITVSGIPKEISIQRCCLSSKWNAETDPFMGYKMGLREVHRQALSDEEIQRMSAKIFPTERLTLVRDIFLFSC